MKFDWHDRARPRSSRSSFKPGIVTLALIGWGLVSPGSALAVKSVADNPDLVNDRFEDYLGQPCLDGPVALQNRGWTIPEIIEYNNAICQNLFSGSFDSSSSESFSSSTNIGSVGAQSKTSETLARQQVDSIEERLAEIKEEEVQRGGWGILLSAQKSDTERFTTDNELGYDSELDGIVAGLDYRFNDRLIVGGALGDTSDDADFAGGGGTLETESRSLMFYATYLIGSNAYIDGYLGAAELDYDSDRELMIDGFPGDNFGFSGTVSADYEGDQELAGVSGGYDWYPGNLSYGVFGAVDYSKTEYDGYEEEGNTGLELAYPDQDTKSLLISLGATASYAFDMGWGQLIPNARVAAVREEENDARSFGARLLALPDVDRRTMTLETDDPDRNYLVYTIGLVAALNNGSQIFVTYEELAEHDFLETSTVTAGFLAEF